MAQALQEEGTALFKKGDFVGARQKYLAALELPGVDAVTVHRNLGLVYLKLGLPAEALRACSECLKLDPTDAKAKYRRAQALLELENYVSAFVYMRTACADLLFEPAPKGGPSATAVTKEWQKLEAQCLKALRVALVHPDLRLQEVGGQGCLVSVSDLPAGTVLLQESRFCKGREQDEIDGGLPRAVDFMLKIDQEGGINKYHRELRGLRPYAPAAVPTALLDRAVGLVKDQARAGTEEEDIRDIAFLALQYNSSRFEDSLYRCASLFTHSCAPTCDRYLLLNSDMVIATLHPVAAGDPLTVAFLSFDAVLAGVAVRQRLHERRFGRPCRCPRCCEDLGLPAADCWFPDGGGYRPYGGGGERLRCGGCGDGFVAFPDIEAPGATSAPCPTCGAVLTHDAVIARYGQCRQALRAFYPSLVVTTGPDFPAPSTEKLTCTHAMAFLSVAIDSGRTWLHPHHHVLRLLQFILSKVTKPVFITEHNRSFAEGKDRSAEDVAHFTTGIRTHRLLPRAIDGMDALCAPSGDLAPPLPPTLHGLAEGHTTIVDILRVYLEERAPPPEDFGDLAAAVREVRRRLPYCTPSVQQTMREVIDGMAAPKKKATRPKDPDQERQAQMMEMLQKMAAERPEADGAE